MWEYFVNFLHLKRLTFYDMMCYRDVLPELNGRGSEDADANRSDSIYEAV